MNNKSSAVTLIELIVSIIIVSLIILGLYGIQIFGYNHVVISNKRAKVQNQISYCLEHMSKYISQASGDKNNPAIALIANGFQARVDFNSPQTPGTIADDSVISYTLSGNTLSASCAETTGSGCPFTSEVLSDKIISGFDNTQTMPLTPASGFYALVSNSGSVIDIGLVGRYDPAAAASIDNPQMSMKSRVVCGNCSAS